MSVTLSSTTDSPEEVQRAIEAAGLEVGAVDEANNEPEEATPASAPPEPLTPEPTEDAAAKSPEGSDPSQPQETQPQPEPPKDGKDGKAGKSNKVQERIDELVRERYQRDGRIQELEHQLQELRESRPKAPDAPAPEPKPEPKVVPPRPTPDDKKADGGDKYEGPWDPAFIEDMANWTADRREERLLERLNGLETRIAEGRQQDSAQRDAQQRQDDFLAAGRAAHEDWDEVAASEACQQVQIAPSFGQALYESELGPSVLRYLVLHPDEGAKVFEKTNHAPNAPAGEVLRAARAVGREMARIEALVRAEAPSTAAAPAAPAPPSAPAPPKPKPSAAPKPITPVSGAAPATLPDPRGRQMSYREYMEWFQRTHPQR